MPVQISPAVHLMTTVWCFSPGPHADKASGCQNLQCGFRACCRSGEWPRPPSPPLPPIQSLLNPSPPPSSPLFFALYPGNYTGCRVSMSVWHVSGRWNFSSCLSSPFQSHWVDRPLGKRRWWKMSRVLLLFSKFKTTGKRILWKPSAFFFLGLKHLSSLNISKWHQSKSFTSKAPCLNAYWLAPPPLWPLSSRRSFQTQSAAVRCTPQTWDQYWHNCREVTTRLAAESEAS